ncbi:MAG: hypothetical protein K2Q22_04285 [Cytophagales bacterium]|nr:hypothetical protein [Cytophagales bacterium]
MNPLRKQLKKVKNLRTWYLKARKFLGIEKHLGMTTYGEQRYYFHYAQKTYSGQGHIVDLGSWLGSTALSLLQGLSKNTKFAQSKNKLFCYDLFLWDSWMDSTVKGTELEGKYLPGDSFLPEFEKRMQRYSSEIVIRPADLTKETWNDGPIEFLLIDAMKSPELCTKIFQNFYPSLIPGVSQILHQDFCHFWTGWIHILQFRLKDYFEYVGDVPHSGSTAFKYTKAIPEELFNTVVDLSQLTDEEIDRAFQYALSFVSRVNAPSVWAAKIMLYVHMANKDKASMVWKSAMDNHIPINEDMEKSRNHLSNLN